MAPVLLRPQGTVARTPEGVRVASRGAEFVFAIPAGTRASRGEGFYVVGNAGVAFADRKRSIGLDVAARDLKHLLLCGLEEGEYRWRTDAGAGSATANAPGLLEVELSGDEKWLSVRKEGR